MPDTLTPQELAAIREDAEAGRWESASAQRDELLAHLDALTAAVENASVEGAAYAEEDNWFGGVEAMRAAVLAIFRGEQIDPDAEAEAEFLKPIKPQGL